MRNKETIINQIAAAMSIDESEIRQRKAFLEFFEEDIVQLKEIHESLSEFQKGFVDDFYDHVLAFEEMSQLVPETCRLERLKKMQSAYFESLTAGQYEWEYVLERLQVGLTHQRVGLDVKWYIGAYRKYLSQLLNYLAALPDLDKPQLIQAVDAILKVIFFDMGLAIDTYLYKNIQTIKNLEQHLDDLIQGVDGFIWEFDVALHKYLYVSQQAEAILGYHQNRWVENAEFPQQITHPDDLELTIIAFNKAIDEGASQEFEYRIILSNGQLLWVNERISVVKNHHGDTILLRGLILDIHERKEHEAQLSYLASYDELTGLPNRNSFESRLQDLMAHTKRIESHLAIMFLDLDGFKDVNDSLGHSAGNQLLKTIAQRIKDTLREQDFAARFGGDEFCIILADISEDYLAAHIANRCLKAIEKPTRISNYEIFPRASIGITIFPQDGETSEILLQCADNAMYAAKAAGKHQFAFYNTKMTRLAEQRLTLENDLRQALNNDEFELYYQPQIALNSGKLVAVEALIRWHHPVRGLVPPDEFISVAEKIGLIIPLGEWVLNQACQQVAKWRQSSIQIGYVAVNISGSHFCDGTLPETVKIAMENAGIEACDLELEITEDVVQTAETSIQNFEKIKDLGVKIAIDDFGTGFSCLSSLTQLPIDSLKIDKAFIQNMLTDTNNSTIVATIIAMSRALGFSVVAEGVETLEQATYLQGVGCEIVQGYYFSKPVTVDQIKELASTDFY